MSVRLPSYLFCLVSSSSPVICKLYSRTVIYSLYSHTNHIRSYKSRSFIQLYIHTLILSHIYACTTYTYMVASVTQSLVWSYPFVSVFKSFQAASPKKNGPLEFTLLILLQVVSPKQRTTWVYLSFSQRCHSPLGRITEYQNFIPRLVGLRNTKISFPAWSDYGIPKFHSPLRRITESKKRHSPVYRITESKKKRLPLLYRITEYQTSIFLRFVGLRKVTQVLFS